MKKFLISSLFIFSLLGCSNLSTLTTEDFFVGNQKNFTGGFENAGYTISSKVIELENKKFLVENTIDTATQVQRVYFLDEDKILLVFVGEGEVADLKNLDLTSGEIILKEPFKVGETWKSKENNYKITSVTSEEIEVTKTFPSGIQEIITYKKGEGKIDRKIK